MAILLKELVMDQMVDNVYAVSIVKDPAIEDNFMHFNKFKFKNEDVYYYTLRPDFAGDEMTIETSHNLCKTHAYGETVTYTESEIKKWAKYADQPDWGFTPDAKSILANFPKMGTDLGACMYNCRHMLKKKQMFHSVLSTQMSFEVATKPRKILGPVMRANFPMSRPPKEMDGLNYGFVWYSNETLEKYFEKFGKKTSVTFLHEFDISDYLITTKSYIDKTDPKSWRWMQEQYVLSDFVWQQIVDGNVRGFSVEIVGTLI